MNDQTFLFTECINLNTEHCQYTKKPEEILSLFSNPESFMTIDSKILELNNQCSGCDWYQRKSWKEKGQVLYLTNLI
jgi:hypothetical protein